MSEEKKLPEVERSGKLSEALSKAQLAFPVIKRDKKVTVNTTKGKYAYTYADLASVVQAVRKPLADNGLAFTQTLFFQDASLWLATVLLHSSGEERVSVYPLPLQQATNDPQRFGSFLTYAKRYALSAILGIVTEEDDDGKVASAGQAISKEHVRNLRAEMEKLGKTVEDVKELTKKVSGQTDPRRLTPEQYDEVFKRLSARSLGDVARDAKK